MSEQTYKQWLSAMDASLPDSAIVHAPCCGRRKPVFSISPRPTPMSEVASSPAGFLCDSCIVEKVRVAKAVIDALYALIPTDSDWELVRYERTLRLTWTDQYDIERIREKINPSKLAEMDEYRQWLRDITEEYTIPSEALAAIVARAIPS